VEADRRYRLVAGPPTGILPAYVAHNRHMLAYAAMMSGRQQLAVDQIRAMVAGMPPEFVKEFAPMAEGYGAMPMEVLVRFGRWDEILREPDAYADYMPFTRAFRHAARAVAFAAKGDTASARGEQAQYLEKAKAVPKEEIIGNDSVSAVIAVVSPMVEGEILVREGKRDEAIAKLREAVAAEDALKYSEPPDWLIPVRHSLGATLMAAKQFADAEAVYREDLARLPENGWSLLGLAQSLKAQGKADEAAANDARFRKAWADADTPISSSCFCQPAK